MQPTLLERDTILSYETRDRTTFYFDAANGFPVSGLGENSEEITLDTKAGHFSPMLLDIVTNWAQFW